MMGDRPCRRGSRKLSFVPMHAVKRLNVVPRAMSVLILLASAVILLQCPVMASYQVTLAWNPSPDSTIAGYHVYYGTASGTYTRRVSIGNTTVTTVPDLNESTTYFFVVTAYTLSGLESLPSNELAYTVAGSRLGLKVLSVTGLSGPAPSHTLLVTSTGTSLSQWVLEASEDLRTWRTVAAGGARVHVPVVVSANPAMFFRLKSDSAGTVLKTGRDPFNSFPGSFAITAAGASPGRWEVEVSNDLRGWNTLACGTNTPVNVAMIVSRAPAMFFRLRGGE